MKILGKLIPIITLICFVCLGIQILFGTEGLTYLTYKYTGNGIKIYRFDLNSYVDNLDIDILKRATTNVIDTNAFKNVLDAWNTIWADGYQFKDILATVANGFVMLINAVILLINIPLVILRICSGIILTGMSIVGININANGIIINALNGILDSATIPYIAPVLPS